MGRSADYFSYLFPALSLNSLLLPTHYYIRDGYLIKRLEGGGEHPICSTFCREDWPYRRTVVFPFRSVIRVFVFF